MKNEIKDLQSEIECLKNYREKIDKENFELFEKCSDLKEKLNKLERDYDTLKRYTKHIQEYLCNDIMNLIDKQYDDSYDDFYGEDYED